MKKIYTADNVAIAWNIKHVLTMEGIETEVRNDELYSVAGEVPVFDVMPEIWINESSNVSDDAGSESIVTKAMTIVANLIGQNAQPQTQWQCEQCGEVNTSAFELCWKCESAGISVEVLDKM